MGLQVRAAFRSRAALPPSTSNPMLAPRRDGRHHRGQAALAVASRRQRRRGARHAGAIRARHRRSRAPAAQAASQAGLHAPHQSPIGFHEQGQRRNNRAENSHQPRKTTRAQDATVQIARISATLLVWPRCRPQHFCPPATFDLAPDSPPVPGRSNEHWQAATAA